MRIFENVETIVVVSELKGVLCNKCGEVFSSHDDKIQSVNTPLGEYGDCKFEMCDKCILKMIKGFAIVPTNFKSNPNYTSSFDLDHTLHQKLFKQWQETNVWNCDENPWKDYYSSDNLNQDNESYEEYEEYNEEISDALEDRKPLHTNPFKLVK